MKLMHGWWRKAMSSTGGIVKHDVQGSLRTFSTRRLPDSLTINGPVMARELDLWRTKLISPDPACRVTASVDCHRGW